MTLLELNDGRSELWQWDTGRTLAVDADCSQVHFSNTVFGRSKDVDVIDGVAVIPDILLQVDKDLNVWAFVGTAENGYTKISKTFKVNRRNKPADYVFTPTEQMNLNIIQRQIGDLSDLTTEAKDTLVAAINEAARTGGGAGSMELRVADGYVQYSRDGGSTWENLIAMADLKGDPGAAGKDGHSPVVTATKSGKTTTISVDGTAIATVEDGADGAPGSRGADGITPTIGSNGNWYLGETDTGKPSRGADGATGATGATGEKGADGKSAYAYAVDGGYTGTEAEFSAKLASVALIVHVTDNNGTLSADKTYVDIRDAILDGTPVLVDYGGVRFPLISMGNSLFFGASQCNETSVVTVIIEIASNDEVHDFSAQIAIPTTLPNPNALTFTGAVTGSYDGSAPLAVNIPSGGGGGGLPTGGAAYQQLVTDGEGNAKWEDRLCYENNVSFIDAQQFVFDSTQMAIGSGDLVVGETYKVIFDSAEYSCKCVNAQGTPVIGSVDFSLSDYPFVIASQNGQLACMVQSAGTYTIGLSGNSVKRIPERFFPISFAKTKTIFFNATDEELNAAYEHYRNGGVLYLAGMLVLHMYGSLDSGGLSFTVYNKIYTFTGGGQYTENDIV